MNDILHQAQAYVMDPLSTLWARLAALLPNLAGAALMMLVGWLLARLSTGLTSRVAAALGLDAFAERVQLSQAMACLGVRDTLSRLLGRLVGLFVFVAFLLSALDALHLSAASEAMRAFLLYFPRVFGALLVIIGGLWLAKAAGSSAERVAEGAGVDASRLIGRIIQGFMTFLTVMLAVRQLQLDVGLVAEVLGIALLAAGAATALALGLGARALAGELLAGAYVRELFAPGDELELDGGRTGEVVEVGAVKTVLRMGDGRLLSLPNRELVDRPVLRRVMEDN